MYAKIAVGTDGSETAGVAVGRAIDLARSTGAELIVLGAFQPDAGEAPEGEDAWGTSAEEQTGAVLDAAVARAAEAGVSAAAHALSGEPANVLVALAKEHGADVLVVGNRGVGAAYFLQSVAKTIVNLAPCDVYVVKTS